MTKGEGKLVMKALSGAKRIEKIGGEGKAFWIAGENCTDYGYSNEEKTENTDRIWGRIELSTEGNKDDEFFNVLYVTDAENDKLAEASASENDKVRSATLLGVTAVFVRSSERECESLSFIGADGTERYYVSGVCAGEWEIFRNGSSCGSATATDEGGFLAFDAPSGKIEISRK